MTGMVPDTLPLPTVKRVWNTGAPGTGAEGLAHWLSSEEYTGLVVAAPANMPAPAVMPPMIPATPTAPTATTLRRLLVVPSGFCNV